MTDHDDPMQPDEQASQEELIREMARRLAATPVRDLLLQTMATFTDMAGVRLGYGPEGPAHRDLGQARLAIEVLRALITVADEQVGAAQAHPFREPLAQLQMVYAQEVDAQNAAASAADDASGQTPGASGLWTPGAEGGAGGEGSSRLWTPGES